MSYLLDTNILSELRKGPRCDANVAAWFDTVGEQELFLSVLTVGELRRGIENIRRHDPSSASALDGWLMRIIALYDDRILPVDREIAEAWGRMNVPDPIPVVDGLLAATARTRGMTLVTRNTKDIEQTGVRFLDPFQVG